MPMVEVECPNESCPGRDVETGVPEAWMAKWQNATQTMEGHWDSTIHCPRCGEEGEEI